MTVTCTVATGCVPTQKTTPSSWVKRWLSTLAEGRCVLDFASGDGRNLSLLVAKKAQIWAADVDAQAIASVRERWGVPPERAMVVDLERAPWPFARGAFDAVVVTRYLFRPRIALLADLLSPSGLLIYETFAEGQARYGRPTRPAFLLQPGELLRHAQQAGLHVVAFEDGIVHAADTASSTARTQRICAVRPPFDPDRFELDARLS